MQGADGRALKGRGATHKTSVQSLDGFEGQFVEAVTAFAHVLDDLFAHAGFPERFEVVGDSGDGFFVRITGEKLCDLIRHVNHVFLFHAQPSLGLFALWAQSFAVDSFSMRVVRRRVSR